MPDIGVRENVPDIRAQFIDGMSRAATCVNVVTTDGPAGRFGVTVSAMSSISADGEHPTVLICVHHQSRSAAAIIENGTFCINVLRDDQSSIADCFADRIRRADGDKFGCARWVRESTGAPRLADPLAAFDCRVLSAERVGTHHIFIGAVETVVTAGPGAALIYADRAYGTTQRIEAPRLKTAGVRPQLTIGCNQVFAPYVMPELLTRMAASHPDGVASLVDGDQRRILDSLKSGETDVALLFDFELGTGIATTMLAEWQPYVLLPTAHALVERRSLALSDLVAEPLIELGSYPSATYCRSLFEAEGLSPRLGITAISPDMVRRLVAHGFGYSLLSAESADVLAQDALALAVIPLSTPVAPCRLVLGSPTRDVEFNPLAQTFRDICRSYFT
jgi:flavin reductase (DIM6/NTAB) family NADH-FMN oxidoreductase RutF